MCLESGFDSGGDPLLQDMGQASVKVRWEGSAAFAFVQLEEDSQQFVRIGQNMKNTQFPKKQIMNIKIIATYERFDKPWKSTLALC